MKLWQENFMLCCHNKQKRLYLYESVRSAFTALIGKFSGEPLENAKKDQ